MKKLITYIGIGLVIMLSVITPLGLKDDIYLDKYREGIWYLDIFNYLEYYIKWGLFYWWFVILVGAILIGLLIFGIRFLILKIKQ